MSRQADLIKNLTDKELLLNLYVTQIMMFVITVVLSRFLFGSWFYPLTLIEWNGTHLFIGVIAAIVVVILELIAVKILPESWFDDGGINERIFKNRHPFHIIFISIIVGFSEEVLFRGVLQTSIGLIPAALIFALIHFRYLHNIFLFLFTISLSIFLGYLYFLTGNLLTVIICHFLIDALLGLVIRYKLLDIIRRNKYENE